MGYSKASFDIWKSHVEPQLDAPESMLAVGSMDFAVPRATLSSHGINRDNALLNAHSETRRNSGDWHGLCAEINRRMFKGLGFSSHHESDINDRADDYIDLDRYFLGDTPKFYNRFFRQNGFEVKLSLLMVNQKLFIPYNFDLLKDKKFNKLEDVVGTPMATLHARKLLGSLLPATGGTLGRWRNKPLNQRVDYLFLARRKEHGGTQPNLFIDTIYEGTDIRKHQKTIDQV